MAEMSLGAEPDASDPTASLSGSQWAGSMGGHEAPETEMQLEEVSGGFMPVGDENHVLHSRSTRSLLKDSVSDLLGQIMKPIASIKNALKDLSQSVVEVVRVSEVNINITPDISPEEKFAVVSVESDRMLRCCCKRRRKPLVFSDFALPLTPESSTLLKTGLIGWDCRVPRLNRIQGNLYLKVRLMSRRGKVHATNSPRSALVSHLSRRSSASSLLSRGCGEVSVFRLRIPYETGSDGLYAELELQRSRHGHDHRCRAFAQMLVCEASQVFDVQRCRPVQFLGQSEWRPPDRQWRELWDSPWRDENLINRTAFLAEMTAEMKSDCILMYQTMFAQSSKSRPERPALPPEEEEAHDMRVLFLKRLILCLAACRLSFCIEENGTTTRPWPFPLASVFCHGGRILLRLDGVNHQEFLNFLLFEDVNAWNWHEGAPPVPLWKRWAATHAVHMNTATSQLFERRLRTADMKRNLSDGYTNHHLGMDLPLGGFGNPAPSGRFGHLCIGPKGVPFVRPQADGAAAKYVKEIQHGHLYLRWDDFGVTSVPVLVPENEEDGSLPAASSTWFQMPCSSIRSAESLEATLKDHGLHEFASGGSSSSTGDCALQQLYHQLVEDKELSIQSNGAQWLRCRGILIHLVFEMEGDGEDRVLVHLAATAQTDAVAQDAATGSTSGPAFCGRPDGPLRIDDLRVPMMLRRRHESWTVAVARYCQTHLDLNAEAAARIVDGCRHAEEDMCVYSCERPPTLCYQHGTYDDRLVIEYEAYRFKFRMQEKDRHLFAPVLKDRFSTTEQPVQLHGFGGHPRAPGTITREWAWLSVEEATGRGVGGLHPPDRCLRLKKETGHVSSLLFGIECSAPRKEDFFGGKHSASAKSNNVSAFGKRKWRDFRRCGQEVPADIGGVHVTVTADGFSGLQRLCAALPLSPPSAGYVPGPEQRVEKQLFRDILQASDEEVGQILKSRLLLTRPCMHDKANTQVMDSYVYRTSAKEAAADTLAAAVQALQNAVALPLQGNVGLPLQSSARTLQSYGERLRRLRQPAAARRSASSLQPDAEAPDGGAPSRSCNEEAIQNDLDSMPDSSSINPVPPSAHFKPPCESNCGRA